MDEKARQKVHELGSTYALNEDFKFLLLELAELEAESRGFLEKADLLASSIDSLCRDFPLDQNALNIRLNATRILAQSYMHARNEKRYSEKSKKDGNGTDDDRVADSDIYCHRCPV